MKQSGQVVLLPFPFTDLSATKFRPALILRKAFGNLMMGLCAWFRLNCIRWAKAWMKS